MFQAVDAASLLRLYLNFDLLDAAAELVMEYVDALLGRGHQYFGIEVRVLQLPHCVLPTCMFNYVFNRMKVFVSAADERDVQTN